MASAQSSQAVVEENEQIIEEDINNFAPVRKSYNTLGLSILCICIASFVIQTELAQFVQTGINFHKPYFILWIAHSCYVIILPLQFMFRLDPIQYLEEFFNVGVELASTVKPTYYSALTRNRATEESDEHNINNSEDFTSIMQILTSGYYRSVIIYILNTSFLFSFCLCIVGYIWYIAVNLTTMAKLTAIYNTSCFWAYAFSIILLNESIKLEKVLATFLSIAGVVIMTYFTKEDKDNGHLDNSMIILMGDLLACFGALMFGLYQVLYKKLGSPPIPSFLFANTITGLIGIHTFFILWIPIPLLHYTGIELFELPDAGTFGYILLIALAGVFFNASYLLVIALTSPLFAAIGIMLTIPIVAWVDLILINTPITASTVIGGFCILIAFILLSWTNIKDEIRKLYLVRDK
ncbi:hypothetical protein RclHR1_01930018 [Rhizophagus clarus]|uniref:DUF6 domain protein, putative n=1 Tax=Rhizophagus clarus TaxID=94130 RepID=A0A2Z6RHH6_9GLOM|nr:hypothetical protein RclHR1_01930018 [Rhizophagus clarus]GES87079.1 DUF6 domain protein, putative [Rhizophagus clarus]